MRNVVIDSKNGQTIEIEVSGVLLERVASCFGVSLEEITDNHIKYYIISSMKNALEAHDVT